MQFLINLPGRKVKWYPSRMEFNLSDKVVVPVLHLAIQTAMDNLRLKSDKSDTLAGEMFESIVGDKNFSELVFAIKNNQLPDLLQDYHIPILYYFDLKKKEYVSEWTDSDVWDKMKTSPLLVLNNNGYSYPKDEDWPKVFNHGKFVAYNGDKFDFFPVYRIDYRGDVSFLSNKKYGYLEEQNQNKMLEGHLLSKAGLKLKRKVLINKSLKQLYGSTVKKETEKAASKSVDFEF